jgi:hypothetical protein
VKKVYVVAVFLLAGLSAKPALADGGVIQGQLKNGTADGAVPADMTVILHIVADGDRVERRQAATDGDGRYRFEGLDTASTVKYLPVVEYGGAMYYTRPLSLAEQANQTADITVYDSTNSDESILYERANLLVRGISAARMDVMEMGAVTNAGDRTYIGPNAPPGAPRPTLNFSIPPGATEVAPQLGFAPGDISPTPDGFTIASPILPGRHQLAFSYSLPFSMDRLQVNKRLEYPTVSFNVYVPDTGLRIESPQLVPQGQTDFGGQKFLLYSAQNLRRGTELGIQVGGLPVAREAGTGRLAWPILLAGSSALLIGLAVTYRRRLTTKLPPMSQAATVADGPRAPHDNGHAGPSYADLQRMQLLLTVARLDERYERGELPEEQYRREREVGKRQLLTHRQSREAAPVGE